MSKDKTIPQLRFPEFKDQGEWVIKTIGDIVISEASNMALNKLELKPFGYPVYGADSIVGYIDDYQQNEKYISIVKDGSGVGRLNLNQSHSSILGTLICLKSKDKKQYYLDWIYYLLNTVDFSVYVKGAGIPHIYYSDYKNENIAIPPPKEQQKIAFCLLSLDKLITAHSQKLEALQDHKKGLMQNLFPQKGKKLSKYRFPEFKDQGEWVIKTIGDIAISEASNMALNKLELKPFGYPVYGADSIVGYIDDYQQNEKYISIVKDGSGVGRLSLNQSYSSILGTLICLKSKDKKQYYLDWIYYLLSTVDFSVYVKGAGIPHIYYSDYKNENIAIPTPQEQQKIAFCLSSLDKLIAAQAEKIEQLKHHKKGLMQGLFPKRIHL